MRPLGENGGTVLRPLPRGRTTLLPGSRILAKTAVKMPIINRIALAEAGFVKWHADDADPKGLKE